MKTIPLALSSLLALSMSVAAWATPPGNGAIKAPLDGMSGPPARPLEGIVRPPTPEATTPKGVSPAVWRQYEYDHATLKINGPNNGKPETKLQLQQAQLDKISGARAVVGKGATIKGVGGIEDNGTNTPVILKVSSQTVTLPGGAEVKAFRLADGNLYYKAPGTGMPTKLGFAAPEMRSGVPVNGGKPIDGMFLPLKKVGGDEVSRAALKGAEFLGKLNPETAMNLSVYPTHTSPTGIASPEELSAITAWAKGQGLQAQTEAGGSYVSITGTAAKVESSLHVEFGNYKMTEGLSAGATIFATKTAPDVPENLPIKAIFGLNNIRVAEPLTER